MLSLQSAGVPLRLAKASSCVLSQLHTDMRQPPASTCGASDSGFLHHPSSCLQISKRSYAAPAGATDQLQNLTQILVHQPFEPNRSPIFEFGYAALETVHNTTGLPWWATIPLTTLTVRMCLLPLSLRQARIIRSSYMLYRETSQLLQREREAAGGGPPAASRSPAQRAKQAVQFLSTFTTMRKAMGAPHPIWIIINPLIQVPIFIYCTATVRNMSLLDWPGFSTGGALWFPDLTLPAALLEPLLDPSRPPLDPSALPMGLPGFILPATITALTLTCIRLGFRAAAASPSTALGAALYRVLPPLLYTLTAANAYMTVQLPQGALLHWTTSSAFTLSLQLAMQQPAFRRWAGLPAPPGAAPAPAALATPNMPAAEAAPAGSTPSTPTPTPSTPIPAPTASSSSPPTAAPTPATPASPAPQPADPLVLAQAAASSNPDLLVIMAAQHSARQHYGNALACLHRALDLSPDHARANYSLGQVHSLLRQWAPAEEAFRRCAASARQPASRGQALYCVGSALQSQGKLKAAVEAYKEAGQLWQGQAVVWYSLAVACSQLGRVGEALEAVEQSLELDSAPTVGRPQEGSGAAGEGGAKGGGSGLRPVLLQLRAELVAAGGSVVQNQ